MVAKIVVTFAGLLLIVLVNWYFFFSRRKPGVLRASKLERKGKINKVRIRKDISTPHEPGKRRD